MDSLKEQTITRVLENFDFEKVHKVMTQLNWEWVSRDGSYLEVPSISRLVLSAEKMMYRAYDNCDADTFFIESGGLRATVYKESDGFFTAKLEFILTSWEADSTYD